MKRVFLSMLFVLALTMAAFANTIDFTNAAGSLNGSASGLSLNGSALIAINSPSGMLTGILGSLAFSTGALTSGSLETGGTFAGGGSFTITGNGTNGIPNGVIFTGTFSGPLTWTVITLADGSHNYSLTGTLQGNWFPLKGTWFTGQTVYGAAVQLTTNVGKGWFGSSTTLSSGDTAISGNGLVITAPEPGSMLFFGTGILGIAGVLRHKSKHRQDSHS
jgi:hypothetical protein